MFSNQDVNQCTVAERISAVTVGKGLEATATERAWDHERNGASEFFVFFVLHGF